MRPLISLLPRVFSGINCVAAQAIIRLASIPISVTIEVINVAHLWLFARMHCPERPSPVRPAVMVHLARHARAADPEACFFFCRRGDSNATFDLWLEALPGARREASDLLRAEAGSSWQTYVEDDVLRLASHPQEKDRNVTDELAAVSTTFALTVRTADAADRHRAFEIAVIHLRAVAAQLPGAAQLPFLFQCWRRWSAGLSPDRRVELAAESAMLARTVPGEPSAAHRAYLRGTTDAVRGQRPGCRWPERYLWFMQVDATHDRLALHQEASAAAALTVRGELAGHFERGSALAAGGRR